MTSHTEQIKKLFSRKKSANALESLDLKEKSKKTNDASLKAPSLIQRNKTSVVVPVPVAETSPPE